MQHPLKGETALYHFSCLRFHYVVFHCHLNYIMYGINTLSTEPILIHIKKFWFLLMLLYLSTHALFMHTIYSPSMIKNSDIGQWTMHQIGYMYTHQYFIVYHQNIWIVLLAVSNLLIGHNLVEAIWIFLMILLTCSLLSLDGLPTTVRVCWFMIILPINSRYSHFIQVWTGTKHRLTHMILLYCELCDELY